MDQGDDLIEVGQNGNHLLILDPEYSEKLIHARSLPSPTLRFSFASKLPISATKIADAAASQPVVLVLTQSGLPAIPFVADAQPAGIHGLYCARSRSVRSKAFAGRMSAAFCARTLAVPVSRASL